MVTPIDRLIFKYMFIQFLDKVVYLRVSPLETMNMFIIPYWFNNPLFLDTFLMIFTSPLLIFILSACYALTNSKGF